MNVKNLEESFILEFCVVNTITKQIESKGDKILLYNQFHTIDCNDTIDWYETTNKWNSKT